jgi:cell division septal protein FtsQ
MSRHTRKRRRTPSKGGRPPQAKPKKERFGFIKAVLRAPLSVPPFRVSPESEPGTPRARRYESVIMPRETDAPPNRRKPFRLSLPRVEIRIGWRWLSAFIIMGLSLVLLLFMQASPFFVHQVEVGGLRHMSANEVFELAEIADLHVFWVDPERVAANVARSPSLSEVSVQVGWPARVVIRVTEREPALIWEQASIRYWVDVNGQVMMKRKDLPHLLTVVAEGSQLEPLGPNDRVKHDVIAGALQLKGLYPNIDRLVYAESKGLGYDDGRGWRVWFGKGTTMPNRATVYEALIADLLARGIQPREVNVADLQAVYYRPAW